MKLPILKQVDNRVLTAEELEQIRRQHDSIGDALGYDKVPKWCAQLHEQRGRLLQTVRALQSSLDSLHGAKFSDRVYVALKSRAETAEAKLLACERLAQQWKDCASKVFEGATTMTKFYQAVYRLVMLFIVFNIAAMVAKVSNNGGAKWPMVIATTMGVFAIASDATRGGTHVE